MKRLLASRFLLVFIGYIAGGLLDISTHHTTGAGSGAAYCAAMVLMGIGGALAATHFPRTVP